METTTYDFSGRVALVSGGGANIGRAVAVLFARAGASVVVADVDELGGRETVDAIAHEGGDALFVETDVSSAASVAAVVRSAIEVYGHLDFGINNAGVPSAGVMTHEVTEDDWDRVMATNLRGVWLSMKYEIPHMLERGEGCIVNTSSILGLVGASMRSAYAASKHGVLGLTRTAALEYGAKNIRVNAVCPGYVMTPRVAASISDPDVGSQVLGSHPIGRLATPEDIAEAIGWLCSDRSTFVLGAALSVDGGYVAR